MTEDQWQWQEPGTRVERTALGNAVVDELYVMCKHYPAIRIFQFCLMPDHLHAVIRVTKVMDTSIRSVIRGYWQGVKKLGRAYTLAVSPELNTGTTDQGRTMDGWAFPIFMERPFIRPLSRRGQLEVMMHYVLINEQHPFILLADNGFRDYYKPSDALFDACAAGRVLILSPWPYDAGKRHISRADCVSLNNMAEAFCRTMNQSEKLQDC